MSVSPLHDKRRKASSRKTEKVRKKNRYIVLNMAKIFVFIGKQFTQLQNYYRDASEYLFQECDPTGLGLFRILFGLCMFLDVFQERGLDDADIRFGDPNYCFFPLFSSVKPVSVQYACVLYSLMWIGSLGILLGYKFRLSCFLYLTPYVYFLILDKSRWNNHSYLFALTVILLSGSSATEFASLDNYFSSTPTNIIPIEPKLHRKCPKWNYSILKFQFTLLYFLASVKKIDMDWLSGYSMRNISKHQLLSPFSKIIGDEVLDFYIIHLGGFVFDFSAGFLLNLNSTKKIGFLLSFLFHGLNSQIFDIGMFPYVCLASLILFCSPEEFPCSLFTGYRNQLKTKVANDRVHNTNAKVSKKRTKSQFSRHNPTDLSSNQPITPTNHGIEKKKNCIMFLLFTYMSLQITLPFTHSVTKGYNNWTKGLYGYSWDMMVYSWDTLHTKITVLDYSTGGERYLDPDVWTTNDRWSSHADMAKQYGDCIARNLANYNITTIEIYFDIWKSLNGRFQQRMFDPRVDILKAVWSPWEEVTWVLPLLHEFSHWRREVFERISKEVTNWTKSSNVIFVADYPGLTLENYLPRQLTNVTLILMKGDIVVEQAGKENISMTIGIDGFNLSLTKNKIPIETEKFHKIHTVSSIPSCYMYTYTNRTEDLAKPDEKDSKLQDATPLCLQILSRIKNFMQEKMNTFTRSFYLIVNSYLNLLFGVPMVIRKS